MSRTVGVVLALLVAATTGVVVAPAAASPQPTPVCPVCGQTFHENVTGTDATLEVRADGDVQWRVENEVTAATAAEWRENETAVRALVAERIDSPYRPPYDPDSTSVDVDGDTVTVAFVDRGAARQRLGLLVLPYLHGEGVAARYAVNADELVVEGPEDYRVLNDPSGATVEDGRATWQGLATTGEPGRESVLDAPEPGDTYVAFGSGATATVAAPLVLTLMPLDPGLYGFYALASLVVLGLSAAGYAYSRAELDRRWLVVAALPTAAFVGFVLRVHPFPPSGTLPGIGVRVLSLMVAVLLGLVGALAFVAAAFVVQE